jgi:type IV pilus assembly protein PilN
MNQINLLPWREYTKKRKQIQFGIIVAVVAALGLFCTIFFHIHYASTIRHQQDRNALLQTELDQQATQLMTLNKQKKELIKIEDQLHFLFTLRESGYGAVRLLNELAILNPDSVTLYKIIRVGDDITVFGKAKSNLQITMFMESIKKSKFFVQPDLTEINGKEGNAGEERNFQLKIKQQR